MPEPLVSVVVPTYNRAALVTEAVKSVLRQGMSGLEVLVVDDGSTDDTRQRLSALGDARVRWLPGTRTGSVAAVRNRGADAAVGTWVAFLDSDDRWLPERLARQIAALGDRRDAWCHCGYRMIDARGRPIPQASGRPWAAREGWLLEDALAGAVTISLGTALVPRTLLRAVGPADTRLLRRQDFELMLRLAAAAPAVAVDQVLVEFREHAGRHTRSTPGPEDYAAQSYLRFLHRGAPPAVRRTLRRLALGHLMRGLGTGLARPSWWQALGLLIASSRRP